MKTWKSGFLTAGLVGILTVLSGCQGESTPTAPGGGGGGGNNPPVNPDVVIEVSNPNPQVLSTTTITATVTIGGQPAPNGTAVEFTTNFGTFTDTGTQTTIRTTLNGQASAVLTSPTAGIARVNVRVTNTNRQTSVTFGEGGGGSGPRPPTITAVTPSTGSPAGGQLVRINGTGFEGPVRVLFGTREAQVVSVTSNQIQVVTPPLDLGAAEFQEVTITVFSRAGAADEASVVAATRFRYEIQILTPTVFSVSPFSGPNEGNTRVTIFGQGFQPPTRVFFGSDNVEAEVLQVTFSQIIVMTPPALGMGAGLRNQTVPVRVLNVLTNKEATLGVGFRYGPTMSITAVGPGSADSGVPTQVTIYGFGFDDPVAVTVGTGSTSVALQPIRVSGTEIVVMTPAFVISGCGNVSGTIRVTNIEDGSTATGPDFTFFGRPPRIASISPQPGASGGTITVVVNNPGAGLARFSIGGQSVVATEVSRVGNVATFSVIVPSNLTFDTQPCPGGGTRSVRTTFPIVFTNVDTGCTDNLTFAVDPPLAPRILVVPTTLTFTSVGVGVAPGPFTFPSSTQSYTVTNTGTATMTITSIATSPTPVPYTSNPQGDPLAAPIVLAPCQSTTVSVTFAPTAAGTYPGSSTVQSDGGNVTVSLNGTATTP